MSPSRDLQLRPLALKKAMEASYNFKKDEGTEAILVPRVCDGQSFSSSDVEIRAMLTKVTKADEDP